MKLVIGLGNPGLKYKDTRHNIGFSAIEAICNKYNILDFTDKFDGKLTRKKISNHDILFFMPMTYMNNSGIPVGKLVNFYKIAVENIFVIYDDLDLSIGKIRIKVGGGNAGHNGLKSIDQHIGNNYCKVRIGIDKPQKTSMITNYVLGKFEENDLKKINNIFHFLADNFNLILNYEKEKFLNMYYSRLYCKEELRIKLS
jgi:peptidyl-tRNA hydrolase, PTH1 family